MDTFPSIEGRRDLRLGVARRQVPEILFWAGLLTLAFAVVNYATLPGESADTWIINAVFGPLFLTIAWILHKDWLPDAAVPWVWAVCSTVLVAMLVNAYVQMPTPANLAYVAVVMVAVGPLSFAWPAFLTAAVAMQALAVVGFSTVVSGSTLVENVLVCVAAVLVSALLLRLRLHALADLADSQARLAHQAMYDPMTDLLNRHGLERSGAALVASANRSGERVLVWFVDIRGLKRANDQLGHRFGDELIRTVARALRKSVRTNDLLFRWGGDEFLVLGTGLEGSAEDLGDRVNSALAVDPDLGDRWHAEVTVGYASGSSIEELDAVISRADADMYGRRSAA